MRWLAASIAVAVVLGLHTPALAHSSAEQVEWEQEWLARVAEAGSLSDELVAEWREFQIRHRPVPVVASEGPRRATAGGGGGGGYSGMGGGNVEQWRGLVAAYFPADQVDRALRIMACESGGNPNAYNPSGASGLFQVLASWADNFGLSPSDLFVPEINVMVASKLYYDGGWGHWVCRG